MNVSRRARMAAVALAAGSLVAGLGAAPALAIAHPWEAISGHEHSKSQADSIAAKAEAKGFKTVIQVINAHNVEVEYANGFSSKGPANAVCAKVHKAGLPCQAEQEFHGVPKGSGSSGNGAGHSARGHTKN